MRPGKFKKMKSGVVKNKESDRISALPDSVLALILSLLDTVTAVRTSLLSKRWKRMWTLLHTLDFKYNFPNNSKKTIGPFLSFVHNVLKSRENSNLYKFHICVHHPIDNTFFDTCAAYAVRHHVRDLKIRAYTKHDLPLVLPESLITSKPLESLKLINACPGSITLPRSLALPALKVLNLKNFMFSDQNYNGEIFTGCPSLESLVLCKCSLKPKDKVKVLEVSGSNLKNLEVIDWRSPWKCFERDMISVSAPKLVYFKCRGRFPNVHFKEELPFLERVVIDLSCAEACAAVSRTDRMQRIGRSLFHMLGQLCNVGSLSLSFNTVKILSLLTNLRGTGVFTFRNLRYLKFIAEEKGTEMTVPIKVISKLLESTDNEDLVLDHDETPLAASSLREREQELSPLGDLKHSKSRSECQGITIPKSLISYLLENSPFTEYIVAELPKALDEDEL